MRGVVVAVVVLSLVAAGVPAGASVAPAAPSATGSAAAASVPPETGSAGALGHDPSHGTVELDAAVGEQTNADTVTFTHTPSSSGQATADAEVTRDGGDVVFEFVRWENTTSGNQGTSSQWQVSSGHQYRVVYRVVASSTDTGENAGASEGTYSASNLVSWPSGSSGSVSGTVTYVYPQFGPVSADDGTAKFESGSSATAEVTVTVSNDGDGVMVDPDVAFPNLPSGFSVSTSGRPTAIDAHGSDSFTLTVTVDESVDEGQYTLDGDVYDNLPSTSNASVSVTVDVVKPPVASVDPIDVGDVLAGESKSKTFTITEAGGYEGIGGIQESHAAGSQYGSIQFSGLPYVETSPGGSDTAEVSVSVPADAPQHATLDWTVTFEPDDADGVSDTATVTARVIYPAEFGTFEFGTTEFVFDEPKSQVSEQTQVVTVSVPNEGDLEMSVDGASASADGPMSATVVSAPDTIPGQGEGEVRVRVSAPASASEGSHGVTVSVSGSDRTNDPLQQSATEQVSVVHTRELRVADASLDYGEVRLTERVTASTDVSEQLEYENVDGLTVEKVSGPDRWLTVEERPPSTLGAGAEAPFVVALEFDTDAELFKRYTWTFRVSGEGVETKTITVSARPKPVNFDAIRQPLADDAGGSGWRSATAGGMVTVFDRLESKLKGGESVPEGDLPSAVAAGEATLLFIDSAEAAQAKIDAGNHSAAQRDVVRAVAAHNIMSFYVDRIESGDLRGPATSAVDAAGSRANSLVAAQTDYLSSRLADGDTTVLERAQLNRQRARLALLQGDEKQAAEYRRQSRAAFDEYIGLVEQASAERQNATLLRERMREETMTVVFGRPLMLNPAKWDAFDRQSAAVLSGYEASAETFAEAGAVEEAATSRELRSEAAAQLQFARYSLYGSTVVYLVGFLGLLGHVARSTYAYVRDANEAVAGDFLVAG